MTGNRKNAGTVCHQHMLALPKHVEAGLLQSSHGVLVVDAGDLRHASGCDFYFSSSGVLEKLIARVEVFLNGGLYVLERFFFCGALRPAAGKSGNRNAVSFFALLKCNLILHH